MKTIYKNRLPHLAPIGASFFVTFRLADSLPQHVVAEMKQVMEAKEKQLRTQFPADWFPRLHRERKRMFAKFEHQLEDRPYGECYLKNPAAANLVAKKLQEYDGQYYNLCAYCIRNGVKISFQFQANYFGVSQLSFEANSRAI